MSVLSPLSQGYGLCQRGGVILIPEASGAIPSYSQKIQGGDGSQLYGHFVPVPKTYLTRRGDIILFTENSCDIVYLEQMYSKKIRELYEQQIKTVDDLNKSILFYGSKTPGEYSLSFIRGRFYKDRDISLQPGHLPSHYLNTLNRHIKLSSVLRSRAPPSTVPAPTPWSRDPTVAKISLGGVEMDDEDDAEHNALRYRDNLPPKPPTPIDMNKLPPIQVSQKYDPTRIKPPSVSPRLNKIKLDAEVLGLHGTNALPPGKDKSEIPVLPKVVTGPSAKASSHGGDWKKLGSFIRTMHAMRDANAAIKDKNMIKLVEDHKPEKSAFRSMMAMDLHFLREDRRTIGVDEYEQDLQPISLDDVLLGLKERRGSKPVLPPLNVDLRPDYDEEGKEESEKQEKEVSRPASTNFSSRVTTPIHSVRRSPYPIARAHTEIPTRSLKSPVKSSRKASPTTTTISPFGESTKSRNTPSAKSEVASEHPVYTPEKGSSTPQKSLYQQTWSPNETHADAEQADPELIALEDHGHPQIDDQYIDHIAQVRAMLAAQNGAQSRASEKSQKSIPAVYVDENEQVYVGEIYGDMEPAKKNQNVPFDYMGLVRSLSPRPTSVGGELTLQSQPLMTAPSQSLQPGLYVARAQPTQPPSSQRPEQHSQFHQPMMAGGLLGIGGVNVAGGYSAGDEISVKPRPTSRRKSKSPRPAARIVSPSELNMESTTLSTGPQKSRTQKKESGYVLRAPVPEMHTVSPDMSFPLRRLHEDKKEKSGYIFREQGESSYLSAASKTPKKVIQPHVSKRNEGYILNKGLPPSGVPQAADIRGLSKSAQHKFSSGKGSSKKVFIMPELDYKTKEIINALDTGSNTEDYDNEHLEIAKQIRGIVNNQDSRFVIQPAEEDLSEIYQSNDQEALLKAQECLAKLREMQNMLDTTDEMFGQGYLTGNCGVEDEAAYVHGDNDSAQFDCFSSSPETRERVVSSAEELQMPSTDQFLGGLPDIGTGREGMIFAGSRPPSKTPARDISPMPVWEPPQLKTQTFGSEEAPNLPTVGEGRYVINPSINYPISSQQDRINYAEIPALKTQTADSFSGVIRGLPARKLPRRLQGFMSHAPSRSRSRQGETPTLRPRSAHAGEGERTNGEIPPSDLSAALAELHNMQIPEIIIDQNISPTQSVDSAVMLDDRYEEPQDTAENLDKIVKLRSELAGNFRPPNSDLDMFSDITEPEVDTPFKADADLISVPSLIRIPEEHGESNKAPSPDDGKALEGSHAGVYLTELERDGRWTNEDIPVYVTPDGKVFISSVIINQPVCDSDRIKFAGQDDADDVHNKPEEGSLTFCGGELTGWVKFSGQEAVKIRGKRWDPRQTGHYVVEQKVNRDWKTLPLNMSIMLGGNVTVNDDPVHNPLFDENGMKLKLTDTQIEHTNTVLLASFSPNCNEFNGKLTSNGEAELDSFLHTKLEDNYQEVEIRGKKWNPNIQGHYYCQKKIHGEWQNMGSKLEITEHGDLVVGDEDLGIPNYNGNEMELSNIRSDHLPDTISVTFLDGKFVGSVLSGDHGLEDIRGVRWNPDIVGRYSTQELVEEAWINKGKSLSINKSGGINYNGVTLHDGFIVDNKIFVVHEGGLDDFFNNAGPVSDTNLAGKSFLMQPDSPQHQADIKVVKLKKYRTEPSSESVTVPDIENAEIVFSSNRCYGHIADGESDAHREIRGYKWDNNIVGEYYTEIAKHDETSWRQGPKISITEDGLVKVNDSDISDTLLKDNIVSINEFDTTTTGPIKHCLVAIQDKLLSGWIQSEPDAPKIQVRGSVWREGPSTHGTYLAAEKQGHDWVSSSKSVTVTASNKVRISDMNIEGDIDGIMAKLQPQQGSLTSTNEGATAEIRFEGDTFSGFVEQHDKNTEISGFKFDFVPGVYLLESRPLNSNTDWIGLNLQFVVSETGRISLGGNAVKNIKMENDVLKFDSDCILQNLGIKFADKAVSGTGDLVKEDQSPSQVEIRGRTWYPKIAGKYETELFSQDSGWKPAKHLEITPQGQVLYGNTVAEGVRLDTDTLSFSCSGPLQDGTLAFDKDGFTGNVVTTRDNKTRVMRGRRIGTRPVSAVSGTELTLGEDQEESFCDLNGQIGSKLKNGSPTLNKEDGHMGMTSDYGSASDMPHQISGSRTEALSSLEEDISYRSHTPEIKPTDNEPSPLRAHENGVKSSRSSSRKSNVSSPKISLQQRDKPAAESDLTSSSPRTSQDVDLDDINLGLDHDDGKGVSFETWPPVDKKELLLNDEEEGIKLDVLPQGLSSLSGTDNKKNDRVYPEIIPEEDNSELPRKNKAAFERKQKIPEIESTRTNGAKSPRDANKLSPDPSVPKSSPKANIPEKVTRTPLPEIPQKTLQKPALTKPVKLPGIDMKEKGKAAEVTEDAGLLKNYMEDKPKKKKKKQKKGAKAKPKNDKQKDDPAPNNISPTKSSNGTISDSDSSSKKQKTALSLEERTDRDIEAAKRRSITPSSKTPISLSQIDRDPSRDSSPISSGSGYNTPIFARTASPGMPQREFQGALMAAKKIRESTIDHDLDGKIPSDIREHPVAEQVAEKFGMEMRVKDDGEQKMSVKERRELARQKKREDAERKRREREEEKRRQKEEEGRRLTEEEEMKRKRAQREVELTAQRERELQRRRDEETKRRQAKLDEKERKKREEDKMMDAKRRLEDELKRRREAEAERLAEIERQKQLALEREQEEREKRYAEAEALRAQMAVEMERELAEYERKVREEEERKRIEEALKAEAERRLLDEEERKRIIALARHLWNKGVRIEGQHIQKELQISSIFYSYFNYLHSDAPFNPEVDFSLSEKLQQIGRSLDNV